jgi:putative SOS response-associated peptidase YedK
MIVTEANEYAGHVHERMPVFLAEDSFASWLGGSNCVPLLKICCICGQYQGASTARATASVVRRFLIPLSCRRLAAL